MDEIEMCYIFDEEFDGLDDRFEDQWRSALSSDYPELYESLEKYDE